MNRASIHIALTSREKQLIADAAKAKDMTVAEWARLVLLRTANVTIATSKSETPPEASVAPSLTEAKQKARKYLDRNPDHPHVEVVAWSPKANSVLVFRVERGNPFVASFVRKATNADLLASGLVGTGRTP